MGLKVGDLVTVHTKDAIFLSNDKSLPFIGGVSRIDEIRSDGFALISMHGRSMLTPVESLRKLKEIDLFFLPGDRQTLAVSQFENLTIHNAVARCHPNDTYDVYEGADVALRRLLGKEDKPKKEKIKKDDMLVVIGQKALFRVGAVVKALEDEKDYTDYVKCFGYSSTYNCLKSYLVEKKYLAKVVEE